MPSDDPIMNLFFQSEEIELIDIEASVHVGYAKTEGRRSPIVFVFIATENKLFLLNAG